MVEFNYNIRSIWKIISILVIVIALFNAHFILTENSLSNLNLRFLGTRDNKEELKIPTVECTPKCSEYETCMEFVIVDATEVIFILSELSFST